MGKHPQRAFTYAGKPLARVNTRAWGKALKRAGIENFRWHDLLHTWAAWHRQAGTPTHELQRLDGWLSSVKVERYAHLAPDQLAKAANRIDPLSVVTNWLRWRSEEDEPQKKTANPLLPLSTQG